MDPFVDFMFNWSEVTCIKHWLVAEVILTAGAHGIPASLTAVLCFCCTPLLLGAVRDALWVWLKCHDGTGSAPVWSREASKNRARAARWAQERAAEAQTASILCLICLPFNAPLSASSPLHPSPGGENSHNVESFLVWRGHRRRTLPSIFDLCCAAACINDDFSLNGWK